MLEDIARYKSVCDIQWNIIRLGDMCHNLLAMPYLTRIFISTGLGL